MYNDITHLTRSFYRAAKLPGVPAQGTRDLSQRKKPKWRMHADRWHFGIARIACHDSQLWLRNDAGARMIILEEPHFGS